MRLSLGTIESKVKVDGLAEFGSDLAKADSTVQAFAQKTNRQFTRVEADIKAVAKATGKSAQEMQSMIDQAFKQMNATAAIQSLERLAKQAGFTAQEINSMAKQMGLAEQTIASLGSKIDWISAKKISHKFFDPASNFEVSGFSSYFDNFYNGIEREFNSKNQRTQSIVTLQAQNLSRSLSEFYRATQNTAVVSPSEMKASLGSFEANIESAFGKIPTVINTATASVDDAFVKGATGISSGARKYAEATANALSEFYKINQNAAVVSGKDIYESMFREIDLTTKAFDDLKDTVKTSTVPLTAPLSAFQNAVSAAGMSVKRSVDIIGSALGYSEKQMQSLYDTAQRGIDVNVKTDALRVLRDEANLSKKELASLEKQLDVKLKSTGLFGKNGFGDILKNVFVYGGAYQLFGILTQLPALAFKNVVAFDSLRTSYSGIFGDEGESRFQYAMDTANKYGKSIETVAGSYKKFAAATEYVGLSSTQTQKIFESVTQAITKVGGSSEDVEGTLLALQQMISKGTVSSEEFRQQFAERIPGAMKMGADALGVTTSMFKSMMENGEIVSSDFLPKLSDQLSVFASGWEKTSQSIESGWERIKNSGAEAVVNLFGIFISDKDIKDVEKRADDIINIINAALKKIKPNSNDEGWISYLVTKTKTTWSLFDPFGYGSMSVNDINYGVKNFVDRNEEYLNAWKQAAQNAASEIARTLSKPVDISSNSGKHVEELQEKLDAALEVIKKLTGEDWKARFTVDVDTSKLQAAIALTEKLYKKSSEGTVETSKKNVSNINFGISEQQAIIDNINAKIEKGGYGSVTLDYLLKDRAAAEEQLRRMTIGAKEAEKELSDARKKGEVASLKEKDAYSGTSPSSFSNPEDISRSYWSTYYEALSNAGIRERAASNNPEVARVATEQWLNLWKQVTESIEKATTSTDQQKASLLKRINDFDVQFTKDTSNLKYGDRNLACGTTDCSGWMMMYFQSLSKALGKSASGTAIEAALNSGGSSGAIIVAVGNAAGGMLRKAGAQIKKDWIKEGMLIGLDTGPHGKRDADHAYGIDHIARVQRGESGLEVAEMSSHGNVSTKSLDSYLSRYSNAQMFIVDPYKSLRGGAEATMGELQNLSAKFDSSSDQIAARSEELKSQLSDDTLAAAFAKIDRSAAKQKETLRKSFEDSGMASKEFEGEYQRQAADIDRNTALEKEVARHKAYQKELKLSSSLEKALGDLQNTNMSVRAGKFSEIDEWAAEQKKAFKSVLQDESEYAKKVAQIEEAVRIKRLQAVQSTATSYPEYSGAYNQLNSEEKQAQEARLKIYEQDLHGFSEVSSKMVLVRMAAYDEIIAAAQKAGDKEREAFAKVNKEDAMEKTLKDIQKYGNATDAFYATLSLKFGTYKDDMSRMRDNAKALGEDLYSLSRDISSAIGDTFGDLLKGLAQGSLDMEDIWSSLLEKLGDAFGNFAKNILEQWLNNIFDSIISNFTSNFLTNTLGSAGSSSWSLLSIFGFANGGAFSGTTLPTNSILTSPTLFTTADSGFHAFASGGMGVAGEAGPEIIMPAVKMPSGNYGVRVQDGDGNQSSKSAQVSTTVPVRIINVWDESVVGDYLSGPAGEKKIMNIVRRNGVM